MQDLEQVYDRRTFKKLELDTEYPVGPITVGEERKILFLHPLDRSPENAISKSRKVLYIKFIVARFCYLFVDL